MTGLLSRPIVPVANPGDAETTARALVPYLPDDARVTVVYVVEKAGGAPDKASVEQREGVAGDAFQAFRERLTAAAVDATVDTDVLYGTDIVETIFAAARARDATAVAFVPREGGRWARLLTGDLALSLVTHNDRPVVALPSPAADDAAVPETGPEESTEAGDAGPTRTGTAATDPETDADANGGESS